MQSEVRKTYQLLFDDLENDFDGFDGFELSPGFVIVISIFTHLIMICYSQGFY